MEKYEKRKVLERINPRTKKVEEIFQTHVIPAAWPMSEREAVLIQLERDRLEAAKLKK